MKHLIFLFIIIILGSCVFAGSYATARYYCINDISNEQLVERVIKLKKDYPQYIIPDSNARKDDIDELGFYDASFYIETENITIYAVINLNEGAINKDRATIGLDVILDEAQTLKISKYYQLKELSKDKRKKVIKIFESEILDKLGEWNRIY